MEKNIALLNFIKEAGILKLVKRSGWWVTGIKNPESVAEHSFRCALIGFLLACEEKADSQKVTLMTLLGDIHEARILDLHKIAQEYFKSKKAEDLAFNRQIKHLPSTLKENLKNLRQEYRKQTTKEALIARDADILECLIQALEYNSSGYKQAKIFLKKAPKFLKTKSAKNLWKTALKNKNNTWWEKLGKFTR